jgi:hypothetical protein
MKRSRVLFAVAGVGLIAAGCTSSDLSDIFARKGAQEERARQTGGLVLPPFYGARPENEQAEQRERRQRTVIQRERPQSAESGTGDDDEAGPGGRSRIEAEVVQKAEAGRQADPVVRRTLDVEAERTVSRETEFVNKILRWDPNRRESEDTGSAADTRLPAPDIMRYRGF